MQQCREDGHIRSELPRVLAAIALVWTPTQTTPTSVGALGANPFPEVTDLVCRLPLPTLFCRPEAFSLGDLLRLTVRPGTRERDLPWLFHAHPLDTLAHKKSAPFQDSSPCPHAKCFKGQPVLQKETTTSSGANGHGCQDCHCVATSVLCVQVAECSRIPFRQTHTSPRGHDGFEASNYTLP